MCHEEHAPILRPVRVEGGEPGLPEAGCEDDETRGIALGPRPFESGERLSLHLVRFGRRRQRLRNQLDGSSQLRGPPGAVPGHPCRVEGCRVRVTEERLEGRNDRAEACAVSGRDDAVVPLDAASQRQLRQIGAADEGDAVPVGQVQDVGLRMEALAGGLEDAELHRAHRLAREGGQVEQTTERVRLGHVEVVAGQHAEVSTAPHDVLEMLVDRSPGPARARRRPRCRLERPWPGGRGDAGAADRLRRAPAPASAGGARWPARIAHRRWSARGRHRMPPAPPAPGRRSRPSRE